MGRDIELLCENGSVAGCLVEHINIVGVLENVLYLSAAQKVFDVLGQPGGNTAPFSETLPDFHGIGRGLIFLEKQVHFVDIVAGGFVAFSIDGDTVPYCVLYDEHPDFFELLTQLLDIEADNAVVDVDIALVVEHIERTGYVDFKRRCDVLRFLLVLLSQLVIQVFQNGHVFGCGVVEIVAIHKANTTVDDGLVYRLKPVLTTHNQLAQRKNEVGFEGKRVFIVRIVQVQVHGVDIVGGGGRNADDLSVQAFHQRPVFRLGVADDDIVVGNEKHVGDFTLGGEGFTAAGSAKDKSIRVFVKKNFFITGNISRFDML